MFQVSFIKGQRLTKINTPSEADARALWFALYMAGTAVRMWRMNKGQPVLMA